MVVVVTQPPTPEVTLSDKVTSRPIIESGENSVESVESGQLPPHKICKHEGINVDPMGDCSKFYICELSGVGKNKWRVYMQQCPKGTAFDAAIEACNHPNRVKGCSKKVKDGATLYVFNRPYHIKK